jgi:putative Holliday junction resolvase
VRLLGLDIGLARVGVAVSDPSGTVATPLTTLDGRTLAADPGPLLRLAQDYQAEGIVVGLPLTLAGAEGPQAASVRSMAERLGERLGLPVTLWDERLTTRQARRSLDEAGLSEREAKRAVDMVAASLILQSYLDANRPAADAAPDRDDT